MNDDVADNLIKGTTKTSDFWYGLGIPICLGFGISISSLIVLSSMIDKLSIVFILFFFNTFAYWALDLMACIGRVDIVSRESVWKCIL